MAKIKTKKPKSVVVKTAVERAPGVQSLGRAFAIMEEIARKREAENTRPVPAGK